MELHPQIIEKEGKNEFVVLPFKEFQALTALINDYEDLRELRKAKEEAKGEKGVPLKNVISELGL
ncbi:prevent-host-death family protein [Candidatus Venteria ishoeyi]|uniref:Antitoxin n=1 Tax=Candidatus Venteria ishoeyi TaxID=1899563 RepID=A0A1H6FH79_9GAMM|nr:prevent-host-death family protein [Candidatus Venteria ishoeyi]SEH08791.1 Uncharacterised protein [Candidatus Venteria ishoeyi]